MLCFLGTEEYGPTDAVFGLICQQIKKNLPISMSEQPRYWPVASKMCLGKGILWFEISFRLLWLPRQTNLFGFLVAFSKV